MLSPDELTDGMTFILQLQPRAGPRKLDKRQLERVVGALEMLEKRAADIYVRPAPAAAP